MHTGLLHLHSLLRYVLLIFLVIAILKAFAGWLGKKEFGKSDQKVGLFLMITAHLQLLIGLGLYFLSDLVAAGLSNMGEAMKNIALRFWTVEHAFSMILAIVLITLGRIMSKKGKDDTAKHRRAAVFFLLAAILIFYAIPWPFSAPEIARGWFVG